MKLKKFLQKQAEKDAEIFLDEDDELFIQQLVQNDASTATVEPKKVKSKKIWAIIGSFATIIVAAIIVFPSVFVNRNNGGIYYQEANVREKTCTFEEMQTDLKYFYIEENPESSYCVLLNYDSVSKDNLYYSLEGTIAISEFKFYIIVNENYNFDFKINGTILSKQCSDYVLSYSKITMSAIDKAEVIYKASIKLETEIVYIEYQQLFDIGEQAFFDDIENIIKVKK